MFQKQSRATAVFGVEKGANVKDTGKVEKKSVPQKKASIGKEKKPSIHERLEINKKIIQEKQGKDKPERGADFGVRELKKGMEGTVLVAFIPFLT